MVLVLVILNGCQNNQAKNDASSPSFLTGTWQPNDSKWIFTVDSQGKLTKMTHFIGAEFSTDQDEMQENWRDNIVATYYLGPCTLDFNPQTRKLNIDIIIEHYMIDFGNGVMEGSFEDHLEGIVSEDGNTWTATWVNTASMVDAEENEKIHTMPPQELIFKKTDKAGAPDKADTPKTETSTN